MQAEALCWKSGFGVVDIEEEFEQLAGFRLEIHPFEKLGDAHSFCSWIRRAMSCALCSAMKRSLASSILLSKLCFILRYFFLFID